MTPEERDRLRASSDATCVMCGQPIRPGMIALDADAGLVCGTCAPDETWMDHVRSIAACEYRKDAAAAQIALSANRKLKLDGQQTWGLTVLMRAVIGKIPESDLEEIMWALTAREEEQ